MISQKVIWKLVKHRKYASSIKTLSMNIFNNGRVTPFPRVCVFNTTIFLNRSLINEHMKHIETGPSTSASFVTLSKCSFQLSGKISNWPFRFQKQARGDQPMNITQDMA